MTISILEAQTTIRDTFNQGIAQLEAAIASDQGGFIYVWPLIDLGVVVGKDGRTHVAGVQHATVFASHSITFTNGKGDRAVFVPRLRALQEALIRTREHLATLEAQFLQATADEDMAGYDRVSG